MSQTKKKYWQKQHNDWEASNLSQPDFCKQHELNYGQFQYWRKKFKNKSTQTKKTEQKFASVMLPQSNKTVSAAQPNGELEINLPSGCTIKINQHTSKALLEMSLEVLKVSTC